MPELHRAVTLANELKAEGVLPSVGCRPFSQSVSSVPTAGGQRCAALPVSEDEASMAIKGW